MKATIQQTSVILGISLVAATLTALFHPKRPPWFSIEDPASERWNLSVIEAKQLMADGDELLWIDARGNEAYKEGHYPGAILLNTDNWGDLMFQNLDRLQSAMGEPVVVYCDGKGCDKSKEVAERLRELLGLDPVYILKGDWKEMAPSFLR